MKYFFWISALLYVAVYFYAAWIYDGFSMPLAIFIFVLVLGFCYWRYKKHLISSNQQQTVRKGYNANSAQRQALSFWRSPIPYIAIAAIAIVVFVVRI